jgi:hypothetical protein
MAMSGVSMYAAGSGAATASMCLSARLAITAGATGNVACANAAHAQREKERCRKHTHIHTHALAQTHTQAKAPMQIAESV